MLIASDRETITFGKRCRLRVEIRVQRFRSTEFYLNTKEKIATSFSDRRISVARSIYRSNLPWRVSVTLLYTWLFTRSYRIHWFLHIYETTYKWNTDRGTTRRCAVSRVNILRSFNIPRKQIGTANRSVGSWTSTEFFEKLELIIRLVNLYYASSERVYQQREHVYTNQLLGITS